MMKYLCDNPHCRLHLAIELRSHARGLAPEWSYMNGFRSDVDKVHLVWFDPEATLSLCPGCRSAFKMGKYAGRLEPQEVAA